MNIAKALAVSAVAGMLMGSTVACGGGNGSTPGRRIPSAAGGKTSCSASGGAAPAGSGKSSCSAAGGGKASCSAAAPRLRSTEARSAGSRRAGGLAFAFKGRGQMRAS